MLWFFLLAHHVVGSTVASALKVYAGRLGRGVQREWSLVAVLSDPPPFHAAPVGGGGHLQLAVRGQAGPHRQTVRQADRAGLRQLAGPALLDGRHGPARRQGLRQAGDGVERSMVGQGIVRRREDDRQAQLLLQKKKLN